MLDEFTAHLDDDAEAEVMAAIGASSWAARPLVIAHRPATTAIADRMVRLEDGRVVEPPGEDRIDDAARTAVDGPGLRSGEVPARGAGPLRWWIVAAALLSFAVTLGAGIGLVAMVGLPDLALGPRRRHRDPDPRHRRGARSSPCCGWWPATRALRRPPRHVPHAHPAAGVVLPGIEPARAGLDDRPPRGDVLSRIVDDVDTLQDLPLRVLVPPIAGALAIGLGCVVLGRSTPSWGWSLLVVPPRWPGSSCPLATRRARPPPAPRALVDTGRDGRRDRRGPAGIAELVAYGRTDLFVDRLDALTARRRAARAGSSPWPGA